MSYKISFLIFGVICNRALAQAPTGVLPNFSPNGFSTLPANVGIPSLPASNGIIPSFPNNGGIPSIPSSNGIPSLSPNAGFPSFPFINLPNPNWSRPSLSSTSEVWQKYFKQLQAARKELLQSLNNYQNSNKTGIEIKPSSIKIPTPPPPFLSGQSFTLLPQIQNVVSQFINQARPPNEKPQRLFPGNNPLALLPPGLIPRLGNNKNSG